MEVRSLCIHQNCISTLICGMIATSGSKASFFLFGIMCSLYFQTIYFGRCIVLEDALSIYKI